jgi:hypothetical protein
MLAASHTLSLPKKEDGSNMTIHKKIKKKGINFLKFL